MTSAGYCETCRAPVPCLHYPSVTYPVETSTSAPKFVGLSTIVPPQWWCGVHHPHGPHRWVTASSLYADCPGSTCSCVVAAVSGVTPGGEDEKP